MMENYGERVIGPADVEDNICFIQSPGSLSSPSSSSSYWSLGDCQCMFHHHHCLYRNEDEIDSFLGQNAI